MAHVGHRLVAYHPLTERVVWEKELSPEDTAALMPVVGAFDGPMGCWPIQIYLEDFVED